MNKVIFELNDGTKKEFDGEKFTDAQVYGFNKTDCLRINCGECPFNSEDCVKTKGFSMLQVARCYRVTEEPKPIQILKRLIEGGSVWIGNNEVFASDIDIFLKRENGRTNINSDLITLEKPKKKIKVERWFNIYPDGGIAFYNSKESADRGAGTSRIACEHFVREYEV